MIAMLMGLILVFLFIICIIVGGVDVFNTTTQGSVHGRSQDIAEGCLGCGLGCMILPTVIVIFIIIPVLLVLVVETLFGTVPAVITTTIISAIAIWVVVSMIRANVEGGNE